MSTRNQIIPQLGVGTFRLQGNDAYQSVKMALDLGYRHVDTAQVYNNESEVGQAVADYKLPRSEVFITTKIWMDNLSPEKFNDSLKDSLVKLKTDYVDLLLIHWPLNDDSVSMDDYLAELKRAKDQALTRYIGVSNFTVAQMEQAISILGNGEILTNQVEVHPYLQNRRVAQFCQQHNISVTAYMPFAYAEALKDPVINDIANGHNATPAQVILAWLNGQNFVAIPSSTKESNLANNLAFDQVKLSSEDVTRIEQLDRNYRLANPDFAPNWD